VKREPRGELALVAFARSTRRPCADDAMHAQRSASTRCFIDRSARV
jgi:hypothetical protein